MKTLILYSSVDGQTQKITNEIREVLVEHHHEVDFFSITEFPKNINLSLYQKILIASSIRYGKHNFIILDFIKKNHELLNKKKSFFISVNLVARKETKNKPETNPYVQKFIKNSLWRPKLTEVFAGKINYKIYSFWDRLIIRLIMRLTKGPIHKNAEIEYTQWEKVKGFGNKIAEF